VFAYHHNGGISYNPHQPLADDGSLTNQKRFTTTKQDHYVKGCLS
jgi:hypothetical protein